MKKKKKNTPVEETPLSLAEEVKSIEYEEEIKKEKRRKSRGLEILRFIVIGVLCTLIDFVAQFCLMKWAFPFLIEQGGWGEYLAWGISVTIAFLIANFVNFFFSRFWVYQNVDKNIKTGNAKTFFIYLGLGVGGWLLGLAIQELGVMVTNLVWPDLALTYDFTRVSLSELFSTGGLAFWAFVIIFAIKTCFTMIYNYLTRKLLIFKEPKKDERPYEAPSTDTSLVVTTQGVSTEPEVEKPHYTTRKSFAAILHEETEKMLGDRYKKVYDTDARRLVREELSKYEDERRARAIKATSPEKKEGQK